VAPLRGLGFYNSGEPSGASQPRRHMQFIPPRTLWERYPQPLRARLGDAGLGANDAAVPVDAAVAAAREAGGYLQPPGQPFTLPAFSGFPHAVCMLGADLADGAVAPHAPHAAARLHGWYTRLLEAATQHVSGGGKPHSDAPSTPTPASSASSVSHNVLLTRRWMLVVPRAQAEWGGLSVNALAFAGLLLTKDASQAQALEAAGPLQVLRACATGLVADA
jgi:sulfate adenylyltransferase (ADP) / ATP adenylyltransferase